MMLHKASLCIRASKLRPLLCYTSQAAAPLRSPDSREEGYADVDWDNLGFALNPAGYMYLMKCSQGEKFDHGTLTPFGNIQLNPAAGVLNYGQGVFEGMKAYRKQDDKIVLFRPDQNAMRLKFGAERLRMPSPSVHQFIRAVKELALANKPWIPPPGKGSLYIRPLLLGSGPILGLGAAPEYIFLVYASPVGHYFKEGNAPLNLYIEEEYVRAFPGGVGAVKTITNYAPVLKAMASAKNRGFSDVLYLDSIHRKYLEEVSACNVFVVKGKLISTPAAVGTILGGVTRKSIIEIARDHGYKVEERAVPVDELIDADEVFCTGTAVVVAPVGSVTYQNKRYEYRTGEGSVSRELGATLTGIQTGHIADHKGWVSEIY